MTPETIARELRREMMAGVLRPGAELSQVALAERFAVSRIPIRDALRILAAEGLVEIEVNRGARTIDLTPHQIREIYDLRILLECDCLRRAGALITPADLAAIERERLKSDLDATGPAWAEGDWAFHRSIYQLARRDRQLTMIESLRRACLLFINAYSTMPAKTPRWLSDHADMVQLLKNRDIEQAVRALHTHLETAADHLFEQMVKSKV